MPTAYYLKVGSPDDHVLGDSRDPHHRGWMKLESFSWGATSAGTHSSGSGGGAGKVNFKTLSVVMATGRGSPSLQLACQTGGHFKTAVLDVADPNSGLPTLRVTLSDVMVDSFQDQSPDPRGRGSVMEAITFSFNGLDMNYHPVGDDEISGVLHKRCNGVGHRQKH